MPEKPKPEQHESPKKRALVKTKGIYIKVSPEEKAAITERAKNAGLSISEYMRRRELTVLSKELQEDEIKRECEISKALVNVNQIARWANTFKAKAEADVVSDQVAKLAQAIRLLSLDNKAPILLKRLSILLHKRKLLMGSEAIDKLNEIRDILSNDH